MDIELPFAEAERFGRDEMLWQGGLETIRGWFSLSHTRLAGELNTNTKALKSWLNDPEVAKRIQATTAARIGQFGYTLSGKARELLDQGINVTTLYPLWRLAGELGRSTTSPKFVELCRANHITCVDTGILGIYIPVEQALALKNGELA